MKLIKYLKENEKLNDVLISFYNKINLHQPGNNDDIFLFTNARGGSTLLSNAIAAEKDIVEIFEPLNWKRFITKKTIIQPDYSYIYNSDNIEHILEYLEKILNNQITLSFPHKFWEVGYSFMPKRFVFKFINGKHYMDLIEKNFPRSKIIFFTRHPIPTVLSRITWGWNDYNLRAFYILNDKKFKANVDTQLWLFAKNMLKNGTKLEQYITAWCIENYLPLKTMDSEKWIHLSYEQMLTEPNFVITKLSTLLNLKSKEYILNRIKKPSNSESAYNNQKLFDKSKINFWRKRITLNEERKCFDIIQRFGIEIYTFSYDLPSERMILR